jgi:hypothetical protein
MDLSGVSTARVLPCQQRQARVMTWLGELCVGMVVLDREWHGAYLPAATWAITLGCQVAGGQGLDWGALVGVMRDL